MTGWSTPHRIEACRVALQGKEVSETIEWEQIPCHLTLA